MLGATTGISCPGCFLGAATSHAPRALIKPCVGGYGLKDGRGYGPYQKGYYDGAGGVPMPFGPHCERLGPSADFARGPGGGWVVTSVAGGARPLAGALGLSDRTRDVLAVTGVLLAASGLGLAIWNSHRRAQRRPQRKRRALLYHGRGQQRFMTIP